METRSKARKENEGSSARAFYPSCFSPLLVLFLWFVYRFYLFSCPKLCRPQTAPTNKKKLRFSRIRVEEGEQTQQREKRAFGGVLAGHRWPRLWEALLAACRPPTNPSFSLAFGNAKRQQPGFLPSLLETKQGQGDKAAFILVAIRSFGGRLCAFPFLSALFQNALRWRTKLRFGNIPKQSWSGNCEIHSPSTKSAQERNSCRPLVCWHRIRSSMACCGLARRRLWRFQQITGY